MKTCSFCPSGRCPPASVSLQNQGVQLDHFQGLPHLSYPAGRMLVSLLLLLAPKAANEEAKMKAAKMAAFSSLFTMRCSGWEPLVSGARLWFEPDMEQRCFLKAVSLPAFPGHCSNFGVYVMGEKEGFSGCWTQDAIYRGRTLETYIILLAMSPQVHFKNS